LIGGAPPWLSRLCGQQQRLKHATLRADPICTVHDEVEKKINHLAYALVEQLHPRVIPTGAAKSAFGIRKMGVESGLLKMGIEGGSPMS